MGPIVLSCGRVGTVQIPQVGRRGADEIVMVHGLGANLGFWYAGAVEHFRRFGRVTLFDLPGHGDSAMPEAGYGPRALAGVLCELLDHLGIARAHLVAHSYGGSVALAFALAHPERVKSLVLADARLWAVEPPEVADEANPRVQRLRDAGLSLADDRYDVSVQILIELARLRLASDDPMAAIGDIMPGARGLFAGRRAARKWLKLVDETQAYAEMTDAEALPLEDIAHLEMPILGLYAPHSTRALSAAVLAASCRRFRLQVVPDVGHFFPLTRPNLFARLVLAFYRKLARARRRQHAAAHRTELAIDRGERPVRGPVERA